MQVKIGDFGLACLDDIGKKSNGSSGSGGGTSSSSSSNNNDGKKPQINGERIVSSTSTTSPPSSPLKLPITISASPTASVLDTRMFLFSRSPGNTVQQLLMRESEHTKGVGTSLYASPEQLSGKHYDSKVCSFLSSLFSFKIFELLQTDFLLFLKFVSLFLYFVCVCLNRQLVG